MEKDGKKSKKPPKVCAHCGKPGGRVQINPFDQDISGIDNRERLHDECASDLAMEV